MIGREKFRHQTYGIIPAVVVVCGLLPLPAHAQFAQQGPKLVGTSALGPFEDAKQGSSVALSGDENTAIVGGPFYLACCPPTTIEGAAWVFTLSGGARSQQQQLYLPGFGAEWGLGSSVSLSADGNVAILGAPTLGGNMATDYPGFASVYVRSGGAWTQQATLIGSHQLHVGSQGSSVSLSADGNTAIVGGPNDTDYDLVTHGAAWIFVQSGGVWTEQAKLVGTGVIGGDARQGVSVSLSGDGNTAIVGGPRDNPNDAANSAVGAAWVFALSTDGAWLQQAKLVGGGYSVALSGDGNTAIVGDTSGAGLYVRSGAGWTQAATLVGTGAVHGTGGFSVSLSGDGTTAMVGTSVFTRSEVGWTQQELPDGTGSVGDAAQGSSVALSADGNAAIVGGPNDNNDAGAAWVYSEFVFPGTPGAAACVGQRTSGITRQYGGLNSAAAALGFSGVSALQDSVMSFCQQ